jgi:hypothetical protein
MFLDIAVVLLENDLTPQMDLTMWSGSYSDDTLCWFLCAQILLDPKTKIPKLENSDAPLEKFLQLILDAGLHTHELLHLSSDIAADMKYGVQGDFKLFGIAWQKDVFSSMQALGLENSQ